MQPGRFHCDRVCGVSVSTPWKTLRYASLSLYSCFVCGRRGSDVMRWIGCDDHHIAYRRVSCHGARTVGGRVMSRCVKSAAHRRLDFDMAIIPLGLRLGFLRYSLDAGTTPSSSSVLQRVTADPATMRFSLAVSLSGKATFPTDRCPFSGVLYVVTRAQTF